MLRECLKTLFARQLEVAGNPKRSLLQRLKPAAAGFVHALPATFSRRGKHEAIYQTLS
jgi:hypothetical protein